MNRVVRLCLCSALMIATPVIAQTVISADELVKRLADDKPSKMSAAEIEVQKSLKAVLTDIGKIATLDSSGKIKIEKSLKADYVPAVDLSVYFDFDFCRDHRQSQGDT